MTQKRFLTASEVFQLFGVDADALDQLVESGAVAALPDLGTFKYRSEDFAELVKKGKLVPRTSAEMFQTDAKGDMPFLHLKNEDQGLKFGEKVDFLELDEAALDEQAGITDPAFRTPVVPEKWFDDTDDSIEVPTSSTPKTGVPTKGTDPREAEEATDFEFNISHGSRMTDGSDSDVRLVTDDGEVNFDDYEVPSTGSDSDVRLEGPVSSQGSSRIRSTKKPGSDSDVQIVKSASVPPQSDSDVTILAHVHEPAAHFNAPSAVSKPIGKKTESDSDVTLASSMKSSPEGAIAGTPAKKVQGDSDSDVVLVVGSADQRQLDSPKQVIPKKSDSDSDVRLATNTGDSASSDLDSPPDRRDFDAEEVAEHALEFGDSSVRLEADHASDLVEQEVSRESATADQEVEMNSSDFDIFLDDQSDSEISLESTSHHEQATSASSNESLGATQFMPTTDSDIALEPVERALDQTHLDVEAPTHSAARDSDIALDFAPDDRQTIVGEFDSGSGLMLEQDAADGGFVLEKSEDGIRLVEKADSGIAIQPEDSGISLDQGDSGITLGTTDSGITIAASDSGITFEGTDSGITLADADSGISLSDADSGISLDAGDDLNATIADGDALQFSESRFDGSQTDELGLSHEGGLDSGFNVSLADSDNTMELDSDDAAGTMETVAYQEPKKKSGKKQLALSEAFKLDEPLEVEDLDISEDLDSAGDDFDEEVLDVDEEAFGSGAVSTIEDEEEEDFVKKPAAAAKAKKIGPTEPAWGILAVGPIICASLVMVATVTALIGGMATMWNGAELPTPAGMVISTLAGLL